jgi:hypothetical protein
MADQVLHVDRVGRLLDLTCISSPYRNIRKSQYDQINDRKWMSQSNKSLTVTNDELITLLNRCNAFKSSGPLHSSYSHLPTSTFSLLDIGRSAVASLATIIPSGFRLTLAVLTGASTTLANNAKLNSRHLFKLCSRFLTILCLNLKKKGQTKHNRWTEKP